MKEVTMESAKQHANLAKLCNNRSAMATGHGILLWWAAAVVLFIKYELLRDY